MNRVTRTVTSVSNLTNSNNNNNNTESDAFVSCIIQGRRKIEASIYKNQFRYPAMHIVDKSWHSSWLDFISGKYIQTKRVFFFVPQFIEHELPN